MKNIRIKLLASSLTILFSLTACSTESPHQNHVITDPKPPSNKCLLDEFVNQNSIKSNSVINSYNQNGISNQVINLELKRPVSGAEINNIARQYNARVMYYLKSSNTLSLKLNKPVNSLNQISSMSFNALTKRALPDQKISLIKPVRKMPAHRYNPVINQMSSQNINGFSKSTVNDPYLKFQYGLRHLEMDTLWSKISGGSAVKVAVIDSGVDLSHPELKSKLIQGKNFIDETAQPDDDDGHGTHVAGIIAASINNKLGVASVCGNCNIQIMPVKVLDSKGEGSIAGAAAGIEWAVDNGAKVLNLSLGAKSGKLPEVLSKAVQYANQKGVVVVFAAGNNNTVAPVDVPKGTIMVSATNTKKEKADFSNYGSSITVSAPGDLILSTYATTLESECTGYFIASGTSMAAPHVSAMAAILLSKNTSLTGSQVKSIIETTATDLGQPGWDEYYGHGMMNLKAALASLNK